MYLLLVDIDRQSYESYSVQGLTVTVGRLSLAWEWGQQKLNIFNIYIHIWQLRSILITQL